MELKPCPFCGHEARVEGDQYSDYWVTCTYCECRHGCVWSKGYYCGLFGSAEDAAAEWNTRSEAK